ncbi:MAG: restriction endonuclease subunit S [Chitinophagales bacterium]|nr:restriction endonuclease subunit S [Chitinophagales bacterium]
MRNTNTKPVLRFPEFKEDWNFFYGNELFEPISNKNHNSDLPILAISQEFGAVPRDLINYQISVTDKSVSSYKVVEKGDFIISLRSFQGGIEYSEYKGICSPAYIILRPKRDIEDYFFKYYLKTFRYIQHLQSKLEGIRDGKMISYKYFSEIKLPFPSLTEQKKITDFLIQIDNRIAQLTEKKEHLELYKKGITQKIFSQKLRFKDENGKDFPKWEAKKFENIFKRVTTKNTENNDNVLTISAQYGLINQQDFFNKSVSANDVTGYYLIKKGDFAYNKSYSKGYPMGAIKPLKKYEKGVVSTLYICFNIKDNSNPDFYEHYFESGKINKQIHKIAQEGARNHGLLNLSVVEFFKDIDILKPHIKEQEKIASFLNKISQQISLVNEQLEETRTFKRALLSKMFC